MDMKMDGGGRWKKEEGILAVLMRPRLRHLAPAVTTGRKEEMLSHFSSGVRMHPIGADASG